MPVARRYFDPVGYQFYFDMYSDKPCELPLKEATMEMLTDCLPYIRYWLEHQEHRYDMSIGGGAPGQGLSYVLGYQEDKEAAINHAIELFQHPNAKHFEMRTMTLSVPKHYRCAGAPNQKSINALAKEFETGDGEKDPLFREKLWQTFCCPSDDLRGICYPPTEHRSPQFRLEFLRHTAFRRQDEYNPAAGCVKGNFPDHWKDHAFYRYELFVQIPRYLVDACGEPFAYQEKWCKRLKKLCEHYPLSYGSVNMDSLMQRGFFSPFSSKTNEHDWDSYIPGQAWGMCLMPTHIQLLGGVEHLKESGVFHRIECLNDGHVYLQLTENVNTIPREINRRLGKLLLTHMVIPSWAYEESRLSMSLRMPLTPEEFEPTRFSWFQVNVNGSKG